jgi:thiol-disulfide isomerase/thioredoxin
MSSIVNIYQTINGKDELKEVISLYEFNKRQDISKFYKNKIKNAKDIEKYIRKNKELKIIKEYTIDYNCLIGKCKVMEIEILDLDKKYVGNKHFLKVFYNNFEDLKQNDEFSRYFYQELENQQEIYNISY